MGVENPHHRRLNRVQKDIVERACELLEDEGKCLIVMTTGTGKTVVGSKIIKAHPNSKVLWLTQTEELIYQTRLDLEDAFGAGEVGLYRRADRSLFERITVASLQTIEREEYLEAIPKNHFDLVIVDEAHHSRAASWEKVIRYFKAKRLGLTATPYRHDGKDLDALFGESAVHLSYEEAKKMRLIASEVYRVILTNSKVSGLVTRGNEYKPNELDRLVVSLNRNQIIVDSYKKYGRAFMREHQLPYKSICFCIDVAHAVRMRELFTKEDIPAEILVGKTGAHSSKETIQHRPQTERERREIYQAFLGEKGPEILCVVNVLNEGKNVRDVGCLLMAAPTRSGIIFQQRMGRGCRRIEGVKEHYLVLDYVDLMNSDYPPMTLSRIMSSRYEPEEIITEYYRGKDPIVVDEYVNYLSANHPFTPVKETKWTMKKIAEALQTFYKKQKSMRRADLVPSKTGLPNPSTISRYWGSVSECMGSLKIPYQEPAKSWSKERAEAALRYWAEKNGRVLVTDLGSKNNLPSQKTIYKYWKSWKGCERALELQIWSARAILEAIETFKAAHRRSPTKREFTSHFGLPTYKRVVQAFGTLSAAIQKAA